MRVVITILFLALATFSIAQKGYVVTFKKDTTHGTIKLEDLKVKPRSVHVEARTEFRRVTWIRFTDNNGNEVEYNAGDILGFELDGSFYQSTSIPNKQSGFSTMSLIFAEVVEQGKATLYSVEGTYAKIEAGGAATFEVFSHQYLASQNASIVRLQGSKKKVVEMLESHLADSPTALEFVKDKKFKRSMIQEAVQMYNASF